MSFRKPTPRDLKSTVSKAGEPARGPGGSLGSGIHNAPLLTVSAGAEDCWN